ANYFVGQDPRRWRSGVPMFRRVRYHDVAPGIDIDYYEQGGGLEFDVVIRPGTDPSQARFTMDAPFRLDASGDLRMGAEDSTMTPRAPAVYQDIGGVRHRVDGRFTISANREIGFDIPKYDKSRPLIIDPALVPSTFVGMALEAPQAVASDAQGAMYVAGSTPVQGPSVGFVAN